ncbi:MAG: hypothetical protein U0X75_20665 [Acidobacteriota bacterium]
MAWAIPNIPTQGSWGGRYELYTPRLRKWHSEPETRPLWTDAEDEVMGVDGKVAHQQQSDDLALAHRVSKRFCRADGLDNQTLSKPIIRLLPNWRTPISSAPKAASASI